MGHSSLRRLVLPLGMIILLGQGCLGGTPQGARGPDGGVFKTGDRGVTWAQKRVLIEGPKGVSVGDAAVTSITFDPQDRNTVYAGTETRGILISLDGGDSWQASKGLTGRVEWVAVDPKNKCVVYATQGNKVWKTMNCGRDWAQAWFDPKTDKVFRRIAVDWFNPTILYSGSSEGDIFKSTDGGVSWLLAKRAESGVISIAIHPKDSRVVYVATQGDGVWKTMDGGNTWISIKKELQQFDNARRVTQIVVDPLAPDTVYLISKYGILKSGDAGASWTPLTLTSPPNSVDIRMFAVNPRNNKELNYVTLNTLLVSSDSGVTWTAKKIPSTRPATALAVDPQDGNILYLGLGPVPKQ
jgi:photosystem II stability/assembly factor-like uncharacterized protein